MNRIIAVFLLFFSFNHSFSQNEITISYDESIHLENISNAIHFYITDNLGTTHIKGAKINEYKFETPGNYQIKVVDKSPKHIGQCEHGALPDIIHVVVGRVKMTFDQSRLTFSEPIRKNKPTSHISMTIPVIIETFDHQPAILNKALVPTAGVGTSIVAELNSAQEQLPEGTHLLYYSLRGTATENAYLMFDFVDANQQIQSIALSTPIQN